MFIGWKCRVEPESQGNYAINMLSDAAREEVCSYVRNIVEEKR